MRIWAYSAAFTYVEALVVVLVGSMMFIAFDTLVSSGVRNSMKGMDIVDSIRAANQLFAQIRRDLRSSKTVNTSGTPLKLPVGTSALPDLSTNFGSDLEFASQNATISYNLRTLPQGPSYVTRQVLTEGTVTSTRDFAVPRIKLFRVAKISQDQRVKSGYQIFGQDQLYVQVELESNDPKFPKGRIALSSFFVTGQMTETGWWNTFSDL